MQLFIANIAYETPQAEIRALFAAHGEVHRVRWCVDHVTGNFRGFCFLTMDRDNAELALSALSGYALRGRRLTVKQATQRQQQSNETESKKGEKTDGFICKKN